MKLRLFITAGGIPEIWREGDPVSSRDRSVELTFKDRHENPTSHSEIEIAVEEAL